MIASPVTESYVRAVAREGGHVEVLHGLETPPGAGVVLELHLDMMEAPPDFLRWLTTLGFADDPFAEFYPAAYLFHYTGRTRVPQSKVKETLPKLRDLVELVLARARERGVRMYAESELVREIRHFDAREAGGLRALEGMAFRDATPGAEVKADVHVEFRSGSVPADVRKYLSARLFYWVRTPETERFPAEEIATLQTAEFRDASVVYASLVEHPLPGCTGIHLEQKLGMVPTAPGLPMPEVIAVTANR